MSCLRVGVILQGSTALAYSCLDCSCCQMPTLQCCHRHHASDETFEPLLRFGFVLLAAWGVEHVVQQAGGSTVTICIHVCVCTHVLYVCMHAYVHVCMDVCVCMYVCMYCSRQEAEL